MKKGKINNIMFYIIFLAIIACLLLLYYNALVDQGRADSIESLRKRIENRIDIDSIHKIENYDTEADKIN